MSDFSLPEPKELHDEYYPITDLEIRFRTRETSEVDVDKIGYDEIPESTEIMVLTSIDGNWNHKNWEELKTCYEIDGYKVFLEKCIGTRTEDPTQLFIWES